MNTTTPWLAVTDRGAGDIGAADANSAMTAALIPATVAGVIGYVGASVVSKKRGVRLGTAGVFAGLYMLSALNLLGPLNRAIPSGT
jgi:hypothetical protein